MDTWTRVKYRLLYINSMSTTRTRYPVYTILSAIVVYGIALAVYSSFVGERWAEWFASAFLWALVIVIYVAMGYFVYRIFTQPLAPWDMFWGVFDFYFAFVHAQAGLGMTIYLLDTAPTKDSWLIIINPAASPYAIYVGDFLLTSVTIFNTAGWVGIRPRPSTVPGALWGIFLGATGWFYVLFVIAVVARSIKKWSPLSEKVMEKANKIQAQILPTFRADYGGVKFVSGDQGLSLRELPNPKHGFKRATLRHQRKVIHGGDARTRNGSTRRK